jgi:hypothetical protein
MSTGKNRIIYDDDSVDDERVGEEKVWSGWSEAFTTGFCSPPEPHLIPCSLLEPPSIQQEQLSDWAYDQQHTQDPADQHTLVSAEQQTQDPPEQQTQASAEQPAEKKMNKKRVRSVGSKPERKQRRTVASKPARKRGRRTAMVSHRRPSMDLLEQSPQVLLRRVFSSTAKKVNTCLWDSTLHALTML